MPAVAAGLMLCTYALEQWAMAHSTFFFMRQAFANYATAAVLLFALAIQLKNGQTLTRSLSRDYWVVLGLYFWCAISIIWSIYPSGTRENFTAQFPYIVFFTFLLPLCISNLRELNQAFYTVLILGTCIAVALLFGTEWYGRSVVLNTGISIAVGGLEGGNPLAVASFGCTIALLSLLINFRKNSHFWTILRFGILAIGVALTVKSGSRGQTIGMLVSGIAFLPYSRRFRDLSSFAGVAISLLIAGIIGAFLFDSLSRADYSGERDIRWNLDSMMEAYAGGRFAVSAQLLSAWLDRGPVYWIIGLGSSASFDPNIVGFYPHVVLAEVLGELGIPGLTLFLVVLYLIQRNLRDLWPLVRDDPQQRGIVASTGAILLLYVLMSFKEGSLLGSSILMGLCAILGRVTLTARREAAELAEASADGYTMTDEEFADEARETDEYADYEPAGSAR